MKKYLNYISKIAAVFTASGLVLGAVFIATNLYRPQNASASQITNPVVQENETNQNAITSNTVPAQIKFPLSSEKDGIKVDLLEVQIEKEYISADLCFDFPTSDPSWGLGGPDNLTLSNGVDSIGVYSIEMIPDASTGDLQKDEKGNYIGRCDHVKFPISEGFTLESLRISISKLATDIPETPDCDKAQEKLEAQQLGIKIKCYSEVGQSGFEIMEKPEKMEISEAQNFVIEALTEIHNGPWEFEFVIPQ